MREAVLIVLDSLGIGHAPDAADFGDAGADTLGHILAACPDLRLPNLAAAGLFHAAALAAGRKIPDQTPLFSWGCLSERSAGKDTVTGHWEIAGQIITTPFATFDRFPDSLVEEMELLTGVSFIGNYARSGTAILEELGAEHLRTGRPILYTSADSVIQIAAHEDLVPLPRLHAICTALRPLADRERIGRVIARPFTGSPGAFVRTAGRHDFAMHPPPTVLNRLQESGVEVLGVGKIGDIFSGSGLIESFPTQHNTEGCARIAALTAIRPHGDRLIFANLVDFDSLYGHRRDPAGYGAALERFDAWLGPWLEKLPPDVLVILTADHGNDPTWTGSDHTRERVPLLLRQPGASRCLGVGEGFTAVSERLAEWFGAEPGSETMAVPVRTRPA